MYVDKLEELKLKKDLLVEKHNLKKEQIAAENEEEDAKVKDDSEGDASVLEDEEMESE